MRPYAFYESYFLYVCTMMRICLLISVIIISLNASGVFAQDVILNQAFKTGERLEYRVYYQSGIGNVTAGEAILTVEEWEEQYTGSDKTVFHLTGEGNSTGVFNFFFKVRDKFQSFVDQQTLLPYVFLRETREGKFKKDDKVTFDRERLTAVSTSKTKKIPANVQDVISAIYYMRTFKVNDFDADSMFYLNFFLDDSVYTSAIKFQGRGYIKTKWGRILCLKIAPMMATGDIFADKYPMFVWVSDDENHVPVMGESEVIVGSIKMELVGYSGLVKPLKFIEKP